jgi:hypothetical protein
LGLTFNWGALLGWAAVRGECDWAVVAPLYLAGVSWTLVYDTIYAHQASSSPDPQRATCWVALHIPVAACLCWWGGAADARAVQSLELNSATTRPSSSLKAIGMLHFSPVLCLGSERRLPAQRAAPSPPLPRLQDKEDDVKVGIKSTALTFGARNKQYMAAFSAANLCLLGLTGHAAGCGLPFYAGVAAAGGHLAWQLASVDLDSRSDCWAKFASNTWYGALVFAGIVADRLLA